MKIAGALIAAMLLLALPAQAGKGAGGPKVTVAVIVPADYTSTVTPEQAVTASHVFMGQVNDWFLAEVGEIVDYEVKVIPIPALPYVGRDACGSYAGYALWDWVHSYTKLTYSKGSRIIELVMGAGGWAGHFAPTDTQVDHAGMVGDWGVMEQFGVPVSCIPEWDTPNRGFSHEFAGMMGMYVGGGCYGDGQGCFVGDPLSAIEKESLLRYSGKWLRSP